MVQLWAQYDFSHPQSELCRDTMFLIRTFSLSGHNCASHALSNTALITTQIKR